MNDKRWVEPDYDALERRVAIDASARGWCAGDEGPVLEVLQAAFNGWPKIEITVDPIDHLRWKMSSDPAADRQHRIVESDGEIIGVTLYQIQRLKLRGRVIRVAGGVDSCIHPDYQGKGVHTALRARRRGRARPGADAHFGLRNLGPVTSRIRERFGVKAFLIANRVEALVCALRPWPTDRMITAFEHVTLWARGNLARLRRAFRGRSHQRRAVREVSEFDGRIEAFCEEASQPFEFMVIRDRDYLNWRYADPRAGRFSIRLAEEDGRILGYAVLALSFGRGYIADLLALPGRADVVRSLLDDALTYFRAQRVGAAECWLPKRHPYREAVRAAGFLGKRWTLPLVFRLYNDEEREQGDFLRRKRARIHITAGDTDLV